MPLGNLNPPGHVFPADQIYFYISNPNGDNRRVGSGTLQDLPGTAQGCWFLSGVSDTYPGDPHLALVRSNIYPARAVLLVGNSTPNLDSQNITANN